MTDRRLVWGLRIALATWVGAWVVTGLAMPAGRGPWSGTGAIIFVGVAMALGGSLATLSFLERARRAAQERRLEDEDPTYVAPTPVARGRHAIPLYAGAAAGWAARYTPWPGWGVPVTFIGLAATLAWMRFDHERRRQRVAGAARSAPLVRGGPRHRTYGRGRAVATAAVVGAGVLGGVLHEMGGPAGLQSILTQSEEPASCSWEAWIEVRGPAQEDPMTVEASPGAPVLPTWSRGPQWELAAGTIAVDLTVTWEPTMGQATELYVQGRGPDGGLMVGGRVGPGGNITSATLRGLPSLDWHMRPEPPHTSDMEVALLAEFMAESPVQHSGIVGPDGGCQKGSVAST